MPGDWAGFGECSSSSGHPLRGVENFPPREQSPQPPSHHLHHKHHITAYILAGVGKSGVKTYMRVSAFVPRHIRLLIKAPLTTTTTTTTQQGLYESGDGKAAGWEENNEKAGWEGG